MVPKIVLCTHDQHFSAANLELGAKFHQMSVEEARHVVWVVSTLMVQSVEPEKRRRSWYMARHTTAPVWPVSRCSSHTPSPMPPSSPPLTAVQLDSSNSARLPGMTYNNESRKETAKTPLMNICYQTLCCCCCCYLDECQGNKEMQGLVPVPLVGLDVRPATLDFENSMSADCTTGQTGQSTQHVHSAISKNVLLV